PSSHSLSFNNATTTTRIHTLSLHDALPIWNIRELRNMIERLIILCDKKITEEDVLKFANPGGPITANSLAGNHTSNGFDMEQFTDRKSTRLNSSHVKISYAVFCLKKKNEYK